MGFGNLISEKYYTIYIVSALSRVFVDCTLSDNTNNATIFYDNILMHIYIKYLY